MKTQTKITDQEEQEGAFLLTSYDYSCNFISRRQEKHDLNIVLKHFMKFVNPVTKRGLEKYTIRSLYSIDSTSSPTYPACTERIQESFNDMKKF